MLPITAWQWCDMAWIHRLSKNLGTGILSTARGMMPSVHLVDGYGVMLGVAHRQC
ncbi:hypothetical protein HAX54_021023, partial [Datura stramonium]|nr:hypothetical protein [Datura stramonium]